MRVLLAIFSCHKYAYPHDDWFKRPTTDRVSGIRESWLKDVTVDYKIFRGRSNRPPLSDEVCIDCADDYLHSSEKIKGVIKFALANDYDYIVKVDDDVWVYWDRLDLQPTADYIGGGEGQFCAGPTYWLSRRSMEFLVQTPLATSDLNLWAEDRWVGESLRKFGVKPQHDNRYYVARQTKENQYISDEELSQANNYLTIHSLSPEQMRRHYAGRNKEGYSR